MEIGDYDAVRDLWMDCEGIGLNSVDDSREGIERFLERNPDTSFVADDDKIVGTVLGGYDGRHGYIYHLAVEADYRHMGLGASLATAAMNALKAYGIAKINLVSFKENEGGGSFWDSLEYVPRDDLTYWMKILRDDVEIIK
ncbi:MAG: GNAT family N-acetyltransferase [Acidobacteria bacterium]|nr:MAG: GNAT family N-acetyltransferase [Acidobacteriota bacterium]